MLPVYLRREAFFTCWTSKEAYIKARGEGLSLPLDRFDVSLVPGEPAALLRTLGDPHEACRWSLQALAPGVGYAAALAVEGHGWRLSCWQWAPSWSESSSCPITGSRPVFSDKGHAGPGHARCAVVKD